MRIPALVCMYLTARHKWPAQLAIMMMFTPAVIVASSHVIFSLQDASIFSANYAPPLFNKTIIVFLTDDEEKTWYRGKALSKFPNQDWHKDGKNEVKFDLHQTNEANLWGNVQYVSVIGGGSVIGDAGNTASVPIPPQPRISALLICLQQRKRPNSESEVGSNMIVRPSLSEPWWSVSHYEFVTIFFLSPWLNSQFTTMSVRGKQGKVWCKTNNIAESVMRKSSINTHY